MEFEILATERLLLKKFTPEAFTYIFQHYDEDRVKKELGLSTHEEFLRDKKKAEGGYKTYDRTIVHFKLTLKETNEVIGGGGFHNWYPDHNKAELGYILNKDEHKRKGYMSEAVSTILDYGFNVMHLNRVEACVSPANIASLSLVRKFGFIQEGYLRKHYTRDGEVHDTLIFSLLREEYYS